MSAPIPHPPRPANRLIREKSPYLLQHAHNPVDWYPWGEEAFTRARREGRPLFLSIGYSTCHWCHVMERESFESDAVAALLNRDFVAIKLDREERPDVDRLYMTAMQAMGLGGGWPLNVFLTPDLRPFFGGTYFPPEARLGRPGLLEILQRVTEAWTQHRAELEATGGRVFEALASLNVPDSAATAREPLFEQAYRALTATCDREEGGFGMAPKFPSTVNLNFLLRYATHDSRPAPGPGGHTAGSSSGGASGSGYAAGAPRGAARDMVMRQLDAMRAGGIHDQLGGGFHRYATDRGWLVPHFEKMLYDQAQIAWAYLEGYQVTGNALHATTARDVLTYVARDLTAPEGAFYSAEDADSEGEEGKFYLWTPAEIEAVLGPDDAALFCRRYGVTPAGNFEHGTSILHEVETVEEAGRALGLDANEAARRLEAARVRLLAVRARRVRPQRDDKVLTAWNGLMISAFARGARVLDEPEYARRAERAAEFVWRNLRDEASGALARRWREGATGAAGQLDDYAYLALGLHDLYGATLDPRWLERAVAVTEAQVGRFWDDEAGGFFESPADDADVALRMKDGYDGAEIAGNSIALQMLQTLAVLLDRPDWREKAKRGLDYFARRLDGAAAAMPQMLVAMDLEQSAPRHVVIAGAPGEPDTRALIRELDRRFLPHDTLLFVDGGAIRDTLARLVPFTAALSPQGGRATAYLCIDYACRLPTTDPAAFAAELDGHGAPRAAKEEP